MNSQDLRVVKTQKNIKSAFLEMLQDMPLEKITVSALSRRAQINKATFYLHYQDIYELCNSMREEFLIRMIGTMDYFDLFLKDPGRFLLKFAGTIKSSQESIRRLWPRDDIHQLPPSIIRICAGKVYEACEIDKNEKNDMALEFIFFSTFVIMVKYLHTKTELSQEMLQKMIRALLA